MTKYMLKILLYLQKEKYKTKILSVDRKNIKEKIEENASNTKVSRSILFLLKEEYIAEGIKDGRIKRYYITAKGLDLLEESYVITQSK